jgi:ribose transport system permease protein
VSSLASLRRGVLGQVAQILVVLVVLMAVFAVLKPGMFLTFDNFRTMAVNVAILAILGVGATFVIITAGIDLSVGSVLVFSSVVSAKAMTQVNDGQGYGALVVALVVALVAGGAWGLLNGLLVAYANVPALIVTLGSMGAALGCAQLLTSGVDIRVANQVMVYDIGYGNFLGLPVLVVVALVVVLIGAFLLHRTRFGTHTYAVGSNAEGCRRTGIDVSRHLVLVYLLSGLVAGLAGFLSNAFFQTTTISGQGNTALNVISGVVIGGTSLFGGIGTVFGTVIGLMIPVVLQTGFVILGLQPYWQAVVVGAVLVVAVYVDQRNRARRASGHSGGGLLALFQRPATG